MRTKANKKTSKVRRRRTGLVMIKPPEKKHYDNFGTLTITQSGVIQLLTGVTTQGVQDTQRIGDSIYARTLFLRMTLIANNASNYDNIRVVIVQDRQGYNAPIVLDVFEPLTIGSGFSPFSQYNHYLMSRFKILHDKTHTLRAVSYQCFNFSLSIKVNNKLEYVGAATFKHQVYLILLGDNGNVLQLPICNYVSRLIYTDQ